MFNVKITGLDKVLKDLDDAQRAFKSLDGTIATLKFDPADPNSVQDAIRQMEAAVDDKTAPYRGNDLVQNVATGMKEAYRKAILERATN